MHRPGKIKRIFGECRLGSCEGPHSPQANTTARQYHLASAKQHVTASATTLCKAKDHCEAIASAKLRVTNCEHCEQFPRGAA